MSSCDQFQKKRKKPGVPRCPHKAKKCPHGQHRCAACFDRGHGAEDCHVKPNWEAADAQVAPTPVPAPAMSSPAEAAARGDDEQRVESPTCRDSRLNDEEPLDLPSEKALQQWLQQGPNVLPILSMTPTQQAIELSILTACSQESHRQWLYHLGGQLQEIPEDRLAQFRDGAWLKELKRAYAAGRLAPPGPNARGEGGSPGGGSPPTPLPAPVLQAASRIPFVRPADAASSTASSSTNRTANLGTHRTANLGTHHGQVPGCEFVWMTKGVLVIKDFSEASVLWSHAAWLQTTIIWFKGKFDTCIQDRIWNPVHPVVDFAAESNWNLSNFQGMTGEEHWALAQSDQFADYKGVAVGGNRKSRIRGTQLSIAVVAALDRKFKLPEWAADIYSPWNELCSAANAKRPDQ